MRSTRNKHFIVPPDLRNFFVIETSVCASGDSFLAKKFFFKELFLVVALFEKRQTFGRNVCVKSHLAGATRCEVNQ